MEGESMDPKTERKLQKTLTKLNVTPEDLKAFIASNEAEDEEVNKLVEEANAEKEEPEKKSTDAPEAKQEKEEPAKEEPKQEENAPAPDPNKKEEKEAEPEQKPDEPKAKEEADKKEAPTPEAKDEANEYKKAIEGVNAKIDGLVDALTKAGILVQDKPQVGVDGENLPANDVGKGTQSALDAINKGRKY